MTKLGSRWRYLPAMCQNWCRLIRYRPKLQAVGGLPLALTLIGNTLAYQAATNQPRRLQRALQQMLDVQQRLQISIPIRAIERPQGLTEPSLSLQTSIAISMERLSDDAKQTLQLLACYPSRPNSFSEEIALWIMDAPVETLDELWDAGLLEDCGPGRYSLHQTIADYAQTLASDEQRTLFEQRLQHSWLAKLHEQVGNYPWLDLEWSTVQMVLDTILHTAATTQLAPLISDLQPYLHARGLLALAETYVEQAITQTQALEDRAILLRDQAALARQRRMFLQVDQLAQQGLRLALPQHTQLHCDLLQLLGWAKYRQKTADRGTNTAVGGTGTCPTTSGYTSPLSCAARSRRHCPANQPV